MLIVWSISFPTCLEKCFSCFLFKPSITMCLHCRLVQWLLISFYCSVLLYEDTLLLECMFLVTTSNFYIVFSSLKSFCPFIIRRKYFLQRNSLRLFFKHSVIFFSLHGFTSKQRRRRSNSSFTCTHVTSSNVKDVTQCVLYSKIKTKEKLVTKIFIDVHKRNPSHLLAYIFTDVLCLVNCTIYLYC